MIAVGVVRVEGEVLVMVGERFAAISVGGVEVEGW